MIPKVNVEIYSLLWLALFVACFYVFGSELSIMWDNWRWRRIVKQYRKAAKQKSKQGGLPFEEEVH